MSFSADHLDVAIRPSRWHCALLAVVHLLAIGALTLSGVEPWFAAALALAVVASFAYSLRRFGLLRDPKSVVRVARHEGRWQLGLDGGDLLPVSLESAVVLGWLVVLNFRDASRRHFPVALLPDAVDADEFRHLRVHLKFSKGDGGNIS